LRGVLIFNQQQITRKKKSNPQFNGQPWQFTGEIYCMRRIGMELLYLYAQAVRQIQVTAHCLMCNTDIRILEFGQEE